MSNSTSPNDRAAINRENARHSPGPRPLEGKKRDMSPTGDLSACLLFIPRFHGGFQPKGAIEALDEKQAGGEIAGRRHGAFLAFECWQPGGVARIFAIDRGAAVGVSRVTHHTIGV